MALTILKIILFSFLFVNIMGFFPGGWSTPDLGSIKNDESFKKIVNFVIENINNSSSQTSKKWEFDDVLDYKSQIVAGANYKIVIQIKASDERKVIFAVVYKPLLDQPLILSKYLEIIGSSTANQLASFTDNEILNSLKSTLAHVHEYFSESRVQYHVKKIRWSLSSKNPDGQIIYYLNYELEGTNNEISLWEHWLKKVPHKDALDATLVFFKLPIGKFLVGEFNNNSSKCEEISSYVLCGIKQCNKSEFLSEGVCKK